MTPLPINAHRKVEQGPRYTPTTANDDFIIQKIWVKVNLPHNLTDERHRERSEIVLAFRSEYKGQQI